MLKEYETIIDKELIDQIDKLFNKVDFIDSDELLIFESLKNFYEYNFNKTQDIRSLFKICQLYKRRFKRIHEDIETYALKALEVRDHPDAVVYYGLGVINNNEFTESLEKLRAIDKYLNSGNTKSLLNIFEAVLYWRNSDFEKYVSKLQDFFSTKDADFLPYITIPSSTVWLEQFSPSLMIPKKDIFHGLNMEPSFMAKDNVDYVVAASCDSRYFNKYSRFFIESLSKLDDRFQCFIYITDSLSNKQIDTDTRFTIVELGIESVNNIGPISSAVRYIIGKKLRNYYNSPLIIADFDCVFKSSLLPLIEKHSSSDMALRMLKKNKCLPWEYITAGFGIFYDTDSSSNFLRYVSDYLTYSLNIDDSQWWIDQNALECASRYADFENTSNLFNDLNKFMVIPTGSEKAKLTLLNNALG